MATTFTTGTQFDNSNVMCGIGRMSHEDYESEFSSNATPRPGSSETDNAAAACAVSQAKQAWTFSQAAASRATRLKRNILSRTDYRMGVNLKVRQAFDALGTKLQQQPHSAEVMSEAEFKLLRQAFGNFRVRIIVDESVTFEELKAMQIQSAADVSEHTRLVQDLGVSTPSFATTNADFIQHHRMKNEDLKAWNATLTLEMSRLLYQKERVPSQHVQIACSSCLALQSILSSQTIRHKFISLNALTQAIRSDLVAFLTNDLRSKDRSLVVQQIKDSCVAKAAAAKKKCTTDAACSRSS